MRFVLSIIFLCTLVGAWFVYSEIYAAEAQQSQEITFRIERGESVAELSDRLEQTGVIRNATLFQKYLVLKGLDTQIREGTFVVEAPITLARVVDALDRPSYDETTITILPGWSLLEIAVYFEEQGIATKDELYAVTGRPAYNYKTQKGRPPRFESDARILQDRSAHVSLEGYLSPNTFRIFKDASVEDIVHKLVNHMDSQMTEQMYVDIKKQGRSFFEVLTLASIVEREVQSEKDKALVADIFWRRYDANWALQADSTVHYAVGKRGDVFTTKEDRDSTSAYNTYKYPGLPLGPIASPSIESIRAAIYPESNDNWYFITTLEGEVKYASSLEEHNINVHRYLRS